MDINVIVATRPTHLLLVGLLLLKTLNECLFCNNLHVIHGRPVAGVCS